MNAATLAVARLTVPLGVGQTEAYRQQAERRHSAAERQRTGLLMHPACGMAGPVASKRGGAPPILAAMSIAVDLPTLQSAGNTCSQPSSGALGIGATLRYARPRIPATITAESKCKLPECVATF